MDQLAASFVTQYYEGLLLQPKSLAACYGPDSTMAISHANGHSSVGTGPKEVEQLMLNLSADLPEHRKTLQVSDAQIFSSFDNSSLIIIDGFVLSAEARQAFTHTVLLRGNGVEGEFYIRNDIWRFSAPVSTVAVPAAVPAQQVAVAEEAAEEEEAAAEEEQAEEAQSSEVSSNHCPTEDGEVAESDEEPAKAESVAESSKVSETPSEADASTPAKTPAKSPAKEQPKGPINWAAKARAAPAANASTSAPQRVSPPPQRVKAEDKTKKVEEKPKKTEEKSEEPRRRARDLAKSFLVVKVRDVTDDDVKAGIPAALKSGLVSLRNTSSDNSRVFLDFTQANALELLKDPSLRIAGKTFTVEPQKKR